MKKRFLFLALLLLIYSGSYSASPNGSQLLKQIENDYWQHLLRETPYLQLKFALPIEQLPDLSYEKAKLEAAFYQSILDRLAKVQTGDLSHEENLSLQILKWDNANTVEGLRYFWLDTPVTPYNSPIPIVHRIFTEYQFQSKQDLDHYESLLKQYPLFIRAIEHKVREQYNRGIVLPKDELAQVLTFLLSFQKNANESLFHVNDDRLKGLKAEGTENFQKNIKGIIDSEVVPSLKSLTVFLENDYSKKAPDAVGLWQYPNGREYYRYLAKIHVTLDVTPEQVHEIGIKEVERINVKMKEIRDSVSFKGSKAEFHHFLKTDPRFFPKTAEEIGVKLLSFITRIEPKIDSYFLRMPRARYGVRRLAPALEGAMTFGYYQDPTKTEPEGDYYYNGSNLNERSLLFAGALIYHELIPGHHFQICLQSENDRLPLFRREGGTTAFLEGWAEYASALAGEMGMYQDPYEQYGRLAMEIMLATRLVVDTGMNDLGWSRSKAIEFMQDNILLSDREIRTETLRYSTDIPGQALGYKMGSNRIREIREEAKNKMTGRFDIRKFHDAVLGSGAMPLSVLQEHILWFSRSSE